MNINFTYDELVLVEGTIDFGRMDFPRALYRFMHGLLDDAELDTAKVEDFVIAFMTQFNQKVRRAF